MYKTEQLFLFKEKKYSVCSQLNVRSGKTSSEFQCSLFDV